jgi:exosome complex component RRP43
MLPIENSLGGSIHANYDLMLRHDVYVNAEHDFRVRHCLMSLPESSMEQVEEVYSHPQALAQCEDYINSKGKKAIHKYDTAGSAKLIADGKLINAAAVASKLAASVYGLKILAEGIEDEGNNFTRFLLLSKQPHYPLTATRIKTSIVFALANQEPGVLFKALSVFALRDIHLCKIESRPGKNIERAMLHNLYKPHGETVPAPSGTEEKKQPSSVVETNFRYFFYIDFLAHVEETAAQNALRHLSEIAPFLRVLGSYPCSHSSAQQDVAQDSPVHTPAPLRVGILGFGLFGQFLGKAMAEYGFEVFACSRSDYTELAAGMGVTYVNDLKEFSSKGLDVILMSVSILSFQSQVDKLPWDLLQNTLMVDVLSVKIHPKEILLATAPPSVDVLCTHPMFGPVSGKDSWTGLPFVYDKVGSVK